jgi:hypothetical protein
MATITNHFTNVELLNLNDQPGKPGPLIAVQFGVAPGDMTVTQGMFLLCQDGRWADVVALGAAGKPDLWDDALFDTSTQVMALLDKMDSKPEIKPIEVSAENIAAWLSRTAGLDAKQRIKNLLDIYKERLQNR